MNRTTGTFLAIVVCAVLAVVVFTLTDFIGGRVYASPEEVFNASRVAISKNDLRSWSQCLTDESRDVLAANPIVFSYGDVEKARTNEEKASVVARLEVQKNFGLTESFLSQMIREADAMRRGEPPTEILVRFSQKVLAPVSDRSAFFAEMYGIIWKGKAATSLPLFADGKLTKVEFDGQRAMGVVVVPDADRGAGSPLIFRKQGESWRIDLLASGDMERARRAPGFKHP